MAESLVIIPTYNEIENIHRMLDTVMNLPSPFHVLIVDDGSPDGTANAVKEAQQQQPDRIHLLERSGKLGLGTAYIAGFRWAMERGYELIYEMDCDFSHNPNDLERLRQACLDGADVAVGSRYVRGGKVSNWPVGRILMSYFASVYVNTVLWLGVRDSTAGFKCYRTRVLQTIDLDRIRFIGYAFQIEISTMQEGWAFASPKCPLPLSIGSLERAK